MVNLKICLIVGAFPNMKCGIGDYTSILADHLQKSGNEVYIITSKKANCREALKYKVFNIVENWDFNDKKSIINTLKSIKPDIIHIQYPSDEYGSSLFINLLPRIIKKELREIKFKLVETVHEYLNYTAKGKIRNCINYAYADSIIVVEQQYINKIKSFVTPISKKFNIRYIPISSNIPRSKLDYQEVNKLKIRLDLNENKIISYFGFINELKGIETLIYAMKEIIKIDNTIKLVILSGLSKSDSYQNKILKMIDEFDLKNNIIITGFIDSSEDVANYLKISDLSILPFRDGVSERNGSFLAAYNQNIPIITTSHEKCGRSEDGVWYVKPNDTMQIVKNIQMILTNEPNIQRNILSWQSIVEQHLEVYKLN